MCGTMYIHGGYNDVCIQNTYYKEWKKYVHPVNGLVEDAGRGGLLVPELALSPEFDRDLNLFELLVTLALLV